MGEIDIVDLLRANGYGVVEGKENVLRKIEEIGKRKEVQTASEQRN